VSKEAVDEFAMAWIPVPVGFDPAHRRGLFLAVETTTALHNPLLQPVLDARGGFAAILVAETPAVRPVFVCACKSGVRAGAARGKCYDSIESSHDHPCDRCLEEHVLNGYPAQPA